jgi:hypothetical protein
VEAGSDFALQIQFQPGLMSLPDSAAGAQRVAAENDVAVFKSSGGYWFVALRELVPEWDESEHRRIACGSAGALGRTSAFYACRGGTHGCGVSEPRAANPGVMRLGAARRHFATHQHESEFAQSLAIPESLQ